MFNTYIELREKESKEIVDIYVNDQSVIIWTVGFCREYPKNELFDILERLENDFYIINGYSKLNYNKQKAV